MRFLDEAKIFVKSGDGGNGCLSFRREAFVEYGGPDGGNGGKGGDVWIETVGGMNTLIDFRYQRHYKAGRGINGMGRDRSGKSGGEIVLQVPAGTEILDETGEFPVADLTEDGQRVLIAKGGEGGLGNAHFKSSVNRAPRRTTPGEPGEELWIRLRLKLLADAGLVGLPNAGKSTFLSAVSRAKPKIADYPFTTLYPQLGVVAVDDREFVLADIPGLIEGAHEGVGLGDRFLGHVERCGVLLHLIDGTEEDIGTAYRTIRRELAEYGAGLSEKTEIIGLNKADAMSEEDIAEKKAVLQGLSDNPVMVLSGVTGKGVKDVVRALADLVARRRTPSDVNSKTGDQNQQRNPQDDGEGEIGNVAWSPLGDRQ